MTSPVAANEEEWGADASVESEGMHRYVVIKRLVSNVSKTYFVQQKIYQDRMDPENKDLDVSRLLQMTTRISMDPPPYQKIIERGGKYQVEIKGKRLTSLHDSFQTLNDLHELDLSDNELGISIQAFPPSFSKLEALMVLRLPRNKLNKVPDVIFFLPNLTDLSLNDNELIFDFPTSPLRLD